mmetsp:Transcript_18075/g.39944  ORF Transcript_18075/g.39944 Transcript_18075/m.39944 type:complete len:630 (-) Transcript_18075:27-1916(-)
MGGVSASEKHFRKELPLADDDRMEQLCGDVPRRVREGELGDAVLDVLVKEAGSSNAKRRRAALTALSAVLRPGVKLPKETAEVLRAALLGEDAVSRQHAAQAARVLPAAELTAMVPSLEQALSLVATLKELEAFCETFCAVPPPVSAPTVKALLQIGPDRFLLPDRAEAGHFMRQTMVRVMRTSVESGSVAPGAVRVLLEGLETPQEMVAAEGLAACPIKDWARQLAPALYADRRGALGALRVAQRAKWATEDSASLAGLLQDLGRLMMADGVEERGKRLQLVETLVGSAQGMEAGGGEPEGRVDAWKVQRGLASCDASAQADVPLTIGASQPSQPAGATAPGSSQPLAPIQQAVLSCVDSRDPRAVRTALRLLEQVAPVGHPEVLAKVLGRCGDELVAELASRLLVVIGEPWVVSGEVLQPLAQHSQPSAPHRQSAANLVISALHKLAPGGLTWVDRVVLPQAAHAGVQADVVDYRVKLVCVEQDTAVAHLESLGRGVEVSVPSSVPAGFVAWRAAEQLGHKGVRLVDSNGAAIPEDTPLLACGSTGASAPNAPRDTAAWVQWAEQYVTSDGLDAAALVAELVARGLAPDGSRDQVYSRVLGELEGLERVEAGVLGRILGELGCPSAP